MANNYFKFKQFTILQDRCAMKVGTDGVLLGAWAGGGTRILDIGTGTGLVALMMAQRFTDARLTAVEIDAEAARQAGDNVAMSPFDDRIRVETADIREYAKGVDEASFDAIVCNPPFFLHSLKNPSQKRAVARHADHLPFQQLFSIARHLLSHDGKFSIIIPSDLLSEMERHACVCGFFLSRIVEVKTVPDKRPKRCLMEYAKEMVGHTDRQVQVLETTPGLRSEWYQGLTAGFYL